METSPESQPPQTAPRRAPDWKLHWKQHSSPQLNPQPALHFAPHQTPGNMSTAAAPYQLRGLRQLSGSSITTACTTPAQTTAGRPRYLPHEPVKPMQPAALLIPHRSGPPRDSRRLAIQGTAILLAVCAMRLFVAPARADESGDPVDLRVDAAAAGAPAEMNAETIAKARSIGGSWFVTTSIPPVYLYRDAGRMLDLFSWHQRDSNQDGIPNLQLSHDQEHLIIQSQGYPNHPTAIFPNSRNPNSIAVQDFRFRLPLQPRRSSRITRLPMGPVGMALNGVVFFNPFEQGGMNAVAGYSEVWLDSCCGHPQQTGIYHYHKYPACVKSPFCDDGKQHSPVIGFAFDGFPVHGPWESPGVMARDAAGDLALDVCNGHSDADRGYHYHVTPGRFPYVIGGYRGEVERSSLRQRGELSEGALEDNSSGQSRLPKVITEVLPGNAVRGRQHQLILKLDPRQATRIPLPDAPPDWVQIGPFEAQTIARSGNEVQVTVSIPEDAPAGILLDCHMEFSTAGRRQVFKLNEAFRVTVEEHE